VAAGDFFTGMFTVDAQPDEILTESAAARQAHTGSAFMEVARRQGDYAMMGVAALVTVDASGACVSTRIVYPECG